MTKFERLRTVAAQLVDPSWMHVLNAYKEAVEAMVLSGSHTGPCTNDIDGDPEGKYLDEWEACERHVETAAARENRVLTRARELGVIE